MMEVSEADLTTESLNEVKAEEAGPAEGEAGPAEGEGGTAEGEAGTAEEEGQPATEAVKNGEGHEDEVKMDMAKAGDDDEEVEGVEVGEEVGEEEEEGAATELNDKGEATGDTASAPALAE